MVAVTSGKLLITGGSGYIGAWIVKRAVDRGYSVVAAVRTEAQGQFIVNRFPEYKGKVTYILVPVIEKDGAYDEAVKDVDAIIHAASPVPINLDFDDPQDILRPAIRGSLGILDSAHKFGKNVKRIIYTSSSTAIGFPADEEGPLVRDETMWNTRAMTEVEVLGKNVHPGCVYLASKTYAERDSWVWVKEHAPSWDFVAVLPSYTWGPYIHEAGKTLASTPGVLLNFIREYPDTSGALVGDCADILDTADLHILALETPEAGGERVLVRSATFSWQDAYDVLNSPGFPNINAPGKETKGAGKNKSTAIMSNATAVKLWPDFQYRSFETSIRELGEQLLKDGYLQVVSD